MRRWLLPVLSLLCCVLLVSCQSTDPETGDKVGYPDLDPLLDRVGESRDALKTAVAQFQSAREQLSQYVGAPGDLQATYAGTVSEYDAAVEDSVAVRSAIANVDQAADAVFEEWQVEVNVYTDARIKAVNQAKLGQTWQNYEGMLKVLRHSEAKLDPVLKALSENVTYLQDNLNVGAVASRAAKFAVIDKDLEALIRSMNTAIDSSDAFISSVQ